MIRDAFLLDPAVTFLNHGSFGACPRAVLDLQTELRAELEREPVRFLTGIEPRLDAARAELAAFLHVDPGSLAFVPNATSAVNAVLRSLVFAPGDELLTTDHGYAACRNVLDWVAARAGARVVVAHVPFPLASPDEVVTAMLAAVTPRTRLALVDHVTSPTGLVFPIRRLVAALEAAGVDVLVDGAHAPGMIDLDLAALDAAYYVGNCHKWMCAPKGAGFLVARADRQDGLVPPVISHGLTAATAQRSRFHCLFDWIGTTDPTPWLCIPAAIRTVAALVPGGWPEVRERNRSLALAGRALLCQALAIEPPAPDSMIGALVSLPIPPGDPLALYAELVAAGVQAPVMPFGRQRLVRFAAAIYNQLTEVERLGEVLSAALSRTSEVR